MLISLYNLLRDATAPGEESHIWAQVAKRRFGKWREEYRHVDFTHKWWHSGTVLMKITWYDTWRINRPIGSIGSCWQELMSHGHCDMQLLYQHESGRSQAWCPKCQWKSERGHNNSRMFQTRCRFLVESLNHFRLMAWGEGAAAAGPAVLERWDCKPQDTAPGREAQMIPCCWWLMFTGHAFNLFIPGTRWRKGMKCWMCHGWRASGAEDCPPVTARVLPLVDPIITVVNPTQPTFLILFGYCIYCMFCAVILQLKIFA